MINPKTNRSIMVGGKVYNQLVKQGIIKLQKLSLYEAILYESTPNDLLSLYLTNSKSKQILDSAFLRLLNDKYKVKATNFINFFKAYSIKQISSHHLLYLYNLENSLYNPPISDTSKRYNCVLYLYQEKKKLNLSSYIFGLAVTLMDSYQVYNNDAAIVCLYIASYTLMEYTDINLYYGKRFTALHIDIVKKLNGNLIRPSTVFFATAAKAHQDFAMLSYFSNKLLYYKSSLIAETINYMLTGHHKIYLIAEMPCQLLLDIDQMDLKINIKYQCEEQQKLKSILINKPKIWHLGDFTKLEKVGEGAGGKVYKIKPNLGKIKYVLKTIKNNIEVSILEMMCLQILKNPNIIQLYGFKILPKKTELYLTLGQGDLRSMIHDLGDLNKYFKQLLKGLDYCHYHNIIHRDIKPENIIYDGQLKLIDFGLAVPYYRLKTYLDPLLCGTMNYRAPEALLGDTQYDNKVDVWALCLVFYYMIVKKEFSNLSTERGNLNKIFKQFGTPTNKTWPGVTDLPNWKLSRFKGEKIDFGKYQFIEKGLILNPEKRANTATLLNML